MPMFSEGGYTDAVAALGGDKHPGLTLAEHIVALREERDKWRTAAGILCGEHVGLPRSTCPVCDCDRLSAEFTGHLHRPPLELIRAKCEQYWNEPHALCPEEMHSVLQFIHAAARCAEAEAEQDRNRTAMLHRAVTDWENIGREAAAFRDAWMGEHEIISFAVAVERAQRAAVEAYKLARQYQPVGDSVTTTEATSPPPLEPRGEQKGVGQSGESMPKPNDTNGKAVFYRMLDAQSDKEGADADHAAIRVLDRALEAARNGARNAALDEAANLVLGSVVGTYASGEIGNWTADLSRAIRALKFTPSEPQPGQRADDVYGPAKSDPPPECDKLMAAPPERWVRLPRAVHADFPFTATAPAGVYRAHVNNHGAVSVKVADGSLLGVKPDEFEDCAPPAPPEEPSDGV
jgi:hypothetical protein